MAPVSEELAELNGVVAFVALADDPPAFNVEGGEQRGDAGPFVIMASGARPGRIGSIG